MPNRDVKFQGKLGVFLKQYRRKAEAGWDPNDRSYDREVEKHVKAMRPEELDALMRDDAGAEVPEELEAAWLASKQVPGITFAVGSLALVTSGRHQGEWATIVALVTVHPVPAYLVEFPCGALARVFQPSLSASET